jgi:hypothetical protein
LEKEGNPNISGRADNTILWTENRIEMGIKRRINRGRRALIWVRRQTGH